MSSVAEQPIYPRFPSGIIIQGDVPLHHDLWVVLVRHRAGDRCERCGVTEQDLIGLGVKRGFAYLHAHHIDGDHDNDRLGNGELLCAFCHAYRHGWKRPKSKHRPVNISPEERKRRSEQAKRLYAEGKMGGPVFGAMGGRKKGINPARIRRPGDVTRDEPPARIPERGPMPTVSVETRTCLLPACEERFDVKASSTKSYCCVKHRNRGAHLTMGHRIDPLAD